MAFAGYVFALVVAIAATTVVVSEPDDTAKSQLRILKCCRYGEELQLSPTPAEDDAALPRCGPAASKTWWAQMIYSIEEETLLTSGKLPANWHVVDGQWPKCDDHTKLAHLRQEILNPIIMFTNGSAVREFSQATTGPYISPSNYCSDSTGLLVCTPKKSTGHHAAATMRPRVRRCCGEHANFHEGGNTCVIVQETADAPPLLPNASSAIEIVAGFPNCPKSDNFTIIGNALDAELQPDGSLEINGAILPSGQFCVERIKELNQIAKVFTCPEYAPQRPAVKTTDIRFTLYPVGFIISALFLAATLAAGCLLPASHHVLHWRCQTHHVACLMMGDILMAIIQLAGDSLHGASCKAFELFDLRENAMLIILADDREAGFICHPVPEAQRVIIRIIVVIPRKAPLLSSRSDRENRLVRTPVRVRLLALFASLEYSAGAAGAVVRSKELLGYAVWVVRFPVERADRRFVVRLVLRESAYKRSGFVDDNGALDFSTHENKAVHAWSCPGILCGYLHHY
ncbi:putative G-protein coupled receptor Mth-like 1 [Cyphomyrmex costatus]|uniref:Putative G-protein coupled receptor Mth-like 1 n=1 Tax=Cyphomyrmex costatus TaxID=456900 RepID=A0A195C4Q2_9HYME|nr:putative G-protein coupled receptor Mth-like 1 [Cyphomyrmex costatus]